MPGVDGMRFYTRLKTMTSRWPGKPRAPEFQMPTMK
jgi:malonate-semialdehyde dehydrogenase (acetylating)/methylmalonate-semialdehyde dehydrogenase